LDLCREDKDARVAEDRRVEVGEIENEEEGKPTVVSEDLEEENAAEVVGGEENVDEGVDKEEVVGLLTVELVLEAAPIVPEGLLLNAT
jgi:hypothetical protein